MESPPGSSRSGDTPLGHEYPSENESSMLARKGEAQSWTFEEQFRQVKGHTYSRMDKNHFIWLYSNNNTIYLVQYRPLLDCYRFNIDVINNLVFIKYSY